MKITYVSVAHAQRAWVCRVEFDVQTHRQFTPERTWVEMPGRTFWSALWSGYRAARSEAHYLRSLAGEFVLD